MPYDIGKAFERIEKELMESMIRNMDHHKAEETKEGFQWAQWQVEQLRALEEYRKRNREKFPEQFREINGMIPLLIEEAREEGRMSQEADILEAISKGFKAKKSSGDITGAFFEVNDRKLNALIEATTNDFERAEVAILRRAEDQYRQVIYDAQVYANAGGTTYERAVDMATKDFISKGIDCVEYSNGARHTLSDYADMAIRTAVKRAYLTGEGEKRQEWGIATVIVNKRGNPCPKCAPFCGKVLIDDVWSGGSRTDGSYPLMSLAVEHGLYHPRCRDSHTTYFPGISTADDRWSKEELEEIGANYEADQRQQYAKRQADKYERLADTRLDPENKRQCEARAEGWKSKSDELTERRKRRLAERNKASEPKTSGIQFDDHVSEQQRQLLEDLSSQYNTRLQRVEIGAEKAAGDVDVSGSRMRLSDKHENTAIHEFAHTLAHTNADKFGLTQDQDFWKEIRRIRKEYLKDVEGDPSRWISTYEHSSRSLDEFMAEAFTHAKMRELGIPIPEKYGKDFTYSQQVLDTVSKYFGKKSIEKSAGSSIMISGAISGARNPYGKAAKEHAKKYYGLVRKMTTDVQKIAKTTGFPTEEIQRIKDFVFMEKHDLGGEVLEFFEPDFMMAESWRRLQAGTPEPHDITLLRHEMMEHELMGQGMSQEEAHIITSKKYNYDKEATEFYGKIKKYRKE